MSKIGENIYDRSVEFLSLEFNARATNGLFPLPADLYDQFLQLHDKTDKFCAKLRRVLYDQRHVQHIEKGRKDFVLPPANFLRGDVIDLSESLVAFDPAFVFQSGNGDPMLEAAQIKGFMTCFSKTSDVLSNIAMAFHRTDYMIMFDRMNSDPATAYGGPSCFHEMRAAYDCLKITSAKQMAYLESLRPKRDYDNL